MNFHHSLETFQGCYEAVMEYGQDNLVTVAGIGIGIGLIMVSKT